MKKIGAVGVFLVLFLTCGLSWAAPGDKNWEWSSGSGAGSKLFYFPLVAIDSQGNRILGYSVWESSGDYYGHVVSLNQNGEVNWETDISDGSNLVYITAITVDKDDNIIVGCTIFDGSEHDWKVVKLSSSGAKLREFSYDSGDDYLGDVAVDSEGRIVAVGKTKDSTSGIYSGVVNFLSEGTRKLLTTSTNSIAGRVVFDKSDNAIVLVQVEDGGDYDWKVIGYSSSGTELWSASFDGGHGDDYPADLAVDANGNVAVVGKTKRATGDYDWKVLFYQVSGTSATLKWSDQINGDGGNDTAVSVAFDDIGNVVVGGSKIRGGDENWLIVSYNPSTGTRRWTATYDSTMGGDTLFQIATGGGIVVAVGYSSNGSYCDWRVRAYAASNGAIRWDDVCDSSSGAPDLATAVAVDSNGEAFVAGNCYEVSLFLFDEVKAVDYAGLTPPDNGGDSGGDSGGTDNGTNGDDNGTGGGGGTTLKGHVMRIAEVRTINTPPETPMPLKGTYLGFGDAAKGGSNFKLQAAFPQYINAQKTSVYEVKIFIAAQLPDDYSRLLYITSSKTVEYQPPDKLSSWKPKVKGNVPNTVLMDTSTSSMPSGTHYWYTLVVPSTVPDDFSGVDWSAIPWEVTVNVLEVNQ